MGRKYYMFNGIEHIELEYRKKRRKKYGVSDILRGIFGFN